MCFMDRRMSKINGWHLKLKEDTGTSQDKLSVVGNLRQLSAVHLSAFRNGSPLQEGLPSPRLFSRLKNHKVGNRGP